MPPAALIKSVAVAKPDKFEPYAVQWLSEQIIYKDDLSPDMLSGRTGSWTKRTDVPPTQSAFTNYLLEIRLPILLQCAVEATILRNVLIRW